MSRPPPLPLAEALEQLLGSLPNRDLIAKAHTVPLADALGRVLAADQRATLNVPPADNSAMDGYAVRASDAGKTLPIAQRILAGSPGLALSFDTVARIFTGAEIPPQADAVVMQEDVRLQAASATSRPSSAGEAADTKHAVLPQEISPGQHIRLRGQDCKVGELLLPAGRRLRPQDLGLLASQGVAQVGVGRRLNVALLSTGNELREPGTGALPPGAIYNSNRPMLKALLTGIGCTVMDLGIIPDSLDATMKAMRDAARDADVILSCGGVSVGEADFVRDAVAQLGHISLWRIAIKPGKPFAFGRVADAHFIGLPGNPSSAFVTFLLLARPLLNALQGRSDAPTYRFPGKADFSHAQAGSRDEYLRVTTRLEAGDLWVTPYSNQSSGVLRSVSASDALALIPTGQTINPGERIEVLPLDLLLS